MATAKGNVRTHTRRTKSGKTTTVKQHLRTKKGRALVSPSHAWKLAKRAASAGRRKRRVTAAVLGGLAVAEVSAWLTLRGVGLVIATAGVLALCVALLAGSATGFHWDRP